MCIAKDSNPRRRRRRLSRLLKGYRSRPARGRHCTRLHLLMLCRLSLRHLPRRRLKLHVARMREWMRGDYFGEWVRLRHLRPQRER